MLCRVGYLLGGDARARAGSRFSTHELLVTKARFMPPVSTYYCDLVFFHDIAPISIYLPNFVIGQGES